MLFSTPKSRSRRQWLLPLVAITTSLATHVAAAEIAPHELPSYHYGAPIRVECMNRSSETGEHIETPAHEIQWIPFPMCEETKAPLEFNYGIETEQNCTIPMIDDPFFHLLEFYIHSDAPLACRLPARPPPQVEIVGEKPHVTEYVPLVFALAGTLQLSHMHISTHMNVLLHSTPKHHLHKKDSGVLDSATAYSTSPLTHMEGSSTRRLVIGDPLPLQFSVRWFPTPELPRVEGKVEWQGMGGHIYASTVFYALLSFGAGVCVSSVWFFGSVLPQRLKGRSLGGATPLGYGGGVKDVRSTNKMAVYNESRLNYVWLAWFALSIPIILFIDALHFYPSSWYSSPSAPLHIFHLARQDYIAQYNDPIVQWSPSTSVPGSHDSWIGLFLYLEFGFTLPVVLYGFFLLTVKRKGTTGRDELLFLVYALETALTTLVCIYDVGYWDPAVYSEEAKRTMVLQFFGPWFLVPSIMAVDMARRILGRIKVADESVEERQRRKGQ
ncbi:hypothetical protein QR685DRAFT_595763 [Neurospora intermedia]|uniref:EXPERA domain-containing protein n=1 Tax=Neurospora intermedia TaxID=5142 RepID=A0ABR3DF69_NEUIN